MTGTQRRTKTETSEFEGRSTISAQRPDLRRPKSASRLGAHADHLRTMLATWRKCSAWLASRQRQTLPLSMRQIIHKFLRRSFNGVIEVLAHVLCLAGELDEVRHLPPNCTISRAVFRGAFEDRTEHGNQIDASPASREREAEGRGQPLHKYLIGRPRLWLRQAETIAASPKTQRSRRSLRSGSLSLRTLDE
jgi:hypothetical protein